jgi:hypothetical protein
VRSSSRAGWIAAAHADARLGFLTHYEVVAESLEEALRYVVALESQISADDLEVTEHEVVSERPGELKGVYQRGGRVFYKSVD